MKKLATLTLIALVAFCGLSLTGCGGGGPEKVELDGGSPPPALNQVQMDEYSKEMSSKGEGQGN